MIYLKKKSEIIVPTTENEITCFNNKTFNLYKDFVADQWAYEALEVPDDKEIEDMLNDIFCDNKQKIFVKKVGTDFAGFVNTVDYDDSVMINCLYVAPEYRRKGYATELLHIVESFYACRNLIIKVHDNNYKAIKCYHKSGFKE